MGFLSGLLDSIGLLYEQSYPDVVRNSLLLHFFIFVFTDCSLKTMNQTCNPKSSMAITLYDKDRGNFRVELGEYFVIF